MVDKQYVLFKTVFDQTPVSTQIFTPDGETLMVNKAWEALWGLSLAKIKRYNVLKDQQLVEKGIMPYIKRGFKGEAVTIPAIKYIPSNTLDVDDAVPYKWVAANMYSIRNAEKEITHLVLQHEDITERREAEEIKNRLAAIIESSDDAIVSKNLDSIITSWNKSAEKLFGYNAKEAIGKHIRLIIPDYLQSQEDEIIRKIKAGKHIDHFETIRQRKDGSSIAVSLSISPVKDGSGTIIGASKIARDITEKQRSEKALQESEERLRLALRAGNIGVWDWDIINDKLSWTENVYKIHGVTAKNFAVSFETFQKFIHPDDTFRVESLIQETVTKKKPFNAEFRIVTPADEIRWVDTSAMIWTDEDDRVIRLLGATRDISLQKKLEQDKNDFLSMASHELKTPLTSMKLFIELLHNNLKDVVSEKPEYYLNRIQEQATKLTELTTDLLDVSRIETGKLKLKKEKFMIGDLVREIVEGIQPSTAHHVLEITREPKVFVHADRYRLYQVLVNFLTNAIKYSPKGKNIRISISHDKKTVTVSVQDHGIGIKKEELNKIFDKLYQVAGPKDKTYPGLGLGLYISKEIVERHKGKIWAESSKGKGSTFYFSIPIE